MRDGLTLTDPTLLALPLSPYPFPTLNPDPEALLDFTCWTLSQASVQPSIVHLGTGQGGQLLLGPHVHPHLLANSLLHLALEVQGRDRKSLFQLSGFVCFISPGSALPGSPSGMGTTSLPTRHTEDPGAVRQPPTSLRC